jgi:hypothetical protein
MPRKIRSNRKYDSSCYYEGLWVGYCTISDSERYDVIMKICDNDAARVLRDYAGFSPELKDILKRIAAYEASRPKRQK